MPPPTTQVPAPVSGARTFTRAEFLAALRERGYRRTARWHEELIERRLLDRGTRVAGDPSPRYVWPQTQLELAASLLVQRGKGAHLASLANGVVWIWLWWGDEYVPFRQVPRALIPWRAAEQEPATVHVRKAAREVVSKIAHPQGSGKRRLGPISRCQALATSGTKSCSPRQTPQTIASDFFMQWPMAFIFDLPWARLRA